ncbi:MAG: hypothetical protein HYT28_03780 [Parcubacteria group bacterium]|nr:hypothetical protein [Parcubacteria group bacterium]
MYRVKEPFITRPGQFEKDKESLAVGIKSDALKGDGSFELELKSEPGKIYHKTKEILRKFAVTKKSYWTSPKGSMVAIFPLDIFEVRESPQKSLF